MPPPCRPARPYNSLVIPTHNSTPPRPRLHRPAPTGPCQRPHHCVLRAGQARPRQPALHPDGPRVAAGAGRQWRSHVHAARVGCGGSSGGGSAGVSVRNPWVAVWVGPSVQDEVTRRGDSRSKRDVWVRSVRGGGGHGLCAAAGVVPALWHLQVCSGPLLPLLLKGVALSGVSVEGVKQLDGREEVRHRHRKLRGRRAPGVSFVGGWQAQKAGWRAHETFAWPGVRFRQV